MADSGRLTARQEKALLALLSESTVQAAAKTADVGERTLFRWLQDPAFQTALRALRKEAMTRAVGRLQHEATQAAETLATLMKDTTVPPPSRIAAARSVLEHARAGTDTEELEERIRALELALEQEETPE